LRVGDSGERGGGEAGEREKKKKSRFQNMSRRHILVVRRHLAEGGRKGRGGEGKRRKKKKREGKSYVPFDVELLFQLLPGPHLATHREEKNREEKRKGKGGGKDCFKE